MSFYITLCHYNKFTQCMHFNLAPGKMAHSKPEFPDKILTHKGLFSAIFSELNVENGPFSSEFILASDQLKPRREWG